MKTEFLIIPLSFLGHPTIIAGPFKVSLANLLICFSIEEIKLIIKKLKQKNIGVLITDHNVRETLKIVDKVYIVNEGAIFFEGNPKNAVEDEKIKKFYLGKEFKL